MFYCISANLIGSSFVDYSLIDHDGARVTFERENYSRCLAEKIP